MAAVKSRRQPGRESKKGQRYSHGIWIAWAPVNQQWFLLQGKGTSDSIILDRFQTRAEAAGAAERLTSGRDAGRMLAANPRKRRDPSNGKVTNLAAFRKKKQAASVSRETQDYERREVEDFRRQVAAVDKLPLSERKENAREFQETLQNDPALVAERVGWLLNGSYGRGAYTQAMQVTTSPRMNQSAWLVQTVAALEWQVPPRMTAQAWHTLSAGSRRHLESLIQREIRDALSE